VVFGRPAVRGGEEDDAVLAHARLVLLSGLLEEIDGEAGETAANVGGDRDGRRGEEAAMRKWEGGGADEGGKVSIAKEKEEKTLLTLHRRRG
jgi:hypothetical protein